MKKLLLITAIGLTANLSAEYLYSHSKTSINDYISSVEPQVDERFSGNNFIPDENNVSYSWGSPTFNGNFTSGGTYYYKYLTSHCEMTFDTPVKFFETGYTYWIHYGVTGSYTSGSQRFLITYEDGSSSNSTSTTIDLNKEVKSLRWHFVNGVKFQFFNTIGQPGTADNVSLTGNPCVKIIRSPVS